MKTISCCNCRYFEPSEIMEGAGECRRQPPVVVDALAKSAGTNMSSSYEVVYQASFFPHVDQSSWCGEFQPA